MRITYDPSVDAAYMYLVDRIRPHGVARTYACDPGQVDAEINLDFDSDGRLVGIEVLSASKKLPNGLLQTAERI